MSLDMDEYLEAVNEFGEEMYIDKDYEMLDRLEISVMSVCARYGVEVYMEEYDTG